MRRHCRRAGSCTAGLPPRSAARLRELLVLEELVIRDSTDDAGRVPDHEHARLVLWRPGTTQVVGTSPRVLALRAAVAGPTGTLSFKAVVAGWYYLEVAAKRTASGPYTLSVEKR